jgi:hypothetical protein
MTGGRNRFGAVGGQEGAGFFENDLEHKEGISCVAANVEIRAAAGDALF